MAKARLKRVHVNQHAIKANRQDGGDRPVVTCKTSRSNHYAHRTRIDGPSELVYQPDKPLSCGAVLWIETRAPVVLDGEEVVE